ncbi:hypothetical protein NQZ79_g1946 [Umbelopsis isabellina]|nr:hypothetical protein NQZ79_g1946 [Umbelopsis isabellina]
MTKYNIPSKLPRLIVFDLDDTLWKYEVDCTYGPPFKYDRKNKVVVDCRGNPVELFRDVLEIFALIQTFPDTQIAIASRTTTPDWAAQVLKLYTVNELGSLYSMCSAFEMYDQSKTKHFRRIHQKTHIDYKDMLFFDDNPMNLCVEPMGVSVAMLDYDGMTMEVFLKSLQLYAESR